MTDKFKMEDIKSWAAAQDSQMREILLIERLKTLHELYLTCIDHHRNNTKNIQRAEFFEDVVEDMEDYFPELLEES